MTADDPRLGDCVFVYGTLRQGFVNNEATLAFRSGAEFVAIGTLPGALYSTGWYPALIENGPGLVTGEVWRVATPDLMAVLDAYEGIREDSPEYRRDMREVATGSGPVDAWVYLYIHEVDPAQLIPSGDWADAFVSMQ